MVNEAKGEYRDIPKRYELFADAEALLIEEAFVMPYCVSGGNGYVVSKIHPFEAPFAPFGISSERWKGQKLLAQPMSTEEFNEAYEVWKTEREAALKKAANK